jgi:hypothetical protein
MPSKNYTIFDKITGKVLRNVSCPEDQIAANFNSSIELLIDKKYDETFLIDPDTLIVEKKIILHPETPALGLFDLKQYIASEEDFDKAIVNLGEDPLLYKREHYKQFRIWLYPNTGGYLDAQFKLRSDDPKERKEGKAQLKAYDAVCRSAKIRFPKK